MASTIQEITHTKYSGIRVTVSDRTQEAVWMEDSEPVIGQAVETYRSSDDAMCGVLYAEDASLYESRRVS